MSAQIRIFKTAWFAKTARKAGIDDAALVEAVRQAIVGQAVNMGGGVFKKRLNQNRSRAIMLAKLDTLWALEYLFNKQDKTNITRDELQHFRKIASIYTSLTDAMIGKFLENADWMEINDAQKAIQE